MMERLYHCFGGAELARVDTPLALRMIEASRVRCLPLNTHRVESLDRAEDLTVGYGDATWGAIAASSIGRDLEPVLNINLATSAAEAIARTERAVALSGIRTIKLEVLDHAHARSNDSELLDAARALTGRGLELWPLITANVPVARALEELGCPMIRVQGAPIGSQLGITADALPAIHALLTGKRGRYMLDGGLGTPEQAQSGLELGFDCFLVNSCLFAEGNDPVRLLGEFRAAVDRFDERLSAR
jgi:thiazole synthase ThiGH ThiG subunit